MPRMEAARGPLLSVLGLLGIAAAGQGNAATGGFGGSLALTSDYIYHGISQTCGDPAAQADVHFSSSGGRAASEGFIGLWGSAGLGGEECGSSREVNIYGGYSFAIDQDTSAALLYTHYAYPGGSYTIERLAGHRYDYDEVQAVFAYQDRLYVTLAWTPNALGYGYAGLNQSRSAFSSGVQLHQPLPASFTLLAGVGYDEIADPTGAGYAFWNIGLGYKLGVVELAVSFFDTAAHAERLFGPYVAGGRGAATAIWRF